MHTRNYQFTSLTSMIVIALLACLTGCSGGSINDPITPHTESGNLKSSHDDMTPLAGFSTRPDIGIMGGYTLTISTDDLTAELVPMRYPAIGESWTVSGLSYFETPTKCFIVSGLAYDDGIVTVKFNIKHPFEKGIIEIPPSARNRLDLNIFDLAMVVVPKPLNTINYPMLNVEIPDYLIDNPAGLTNELSVAYGTETALPYVLVVDDSRSSPPSHTYNKFEMGSSTNFEARFPLESGQALGFDLYLTFGYGFSAVLIDRLDPKYFNPEFNRKAAWKVEVIPPDANENSTWDDSDNTTLHDVLVKVYDWQIGANVNPDLEEATDIYAASDVAKVSLEIPGMHDAIHEVTTPSSGAGTPADPLIYTFSIANENLLPIGEYTGIVAVYDERSPLEISDGRDYLIHTDDAGKTLNEFKNPPYVTYQAFKAVVSVKYPPGNLIWAKRAGGAGPNRSNGITTLSDNSTVVTGYFHGTAIFGPGDPIETILTSDAGTTDIFIARYNPDGTLVWAKRAGGSSLSVAYGITALSDDSTVVTGLFMSSATFGPGEPNETILTSAGGYDVFIARYNPDGTLAWAKRSGGPDKAGSMNISTLSDDSTVLVGLFKGIVMFGEGDPNETILTSAGNEDFFIARYNPNGTLVWAKRAGGLENVYGHTITTLSNDSTVVTGSFVDTATFGQGEPNETILTSAGGSDIFVARYNQTGTLSWAKRAGGAGNTQSSGVTTLSDDSTVVTGYFFDTATFGQGEPNQTILTSAGVSDIFIARYNPDGTLEWAKQAGGPSWNNAGNAITTLSDDSSVVTGYFQDTVTFGEDEPNETILTSAGDQDIFIARYAP